MKTTYPKITHPDMGIQIKDARFRVWYHINRKKRFHDLPPRITIQEARTRRDEFYGELALDGAKARKQQGTMQPVGRPQGQGAYVYKRKPYFVRIGGKHLGDFHTEAEAQIAVEKHLNPEWL